MRGINLIGCQEGQMVEKVILIYNYNFFYCQRRTLTYSYCIEKQDRLSRYSLRFDRIERKKLYLGH